MDVAKIVFIVAVVAFTLFAAIWDFRTKKLPNWLTVPGFFAAVVFHLVTRMWADGWWGAVEALKFCGGGFAVGFGILLVLWLIGGGGAGDVKLMGALGAWLGAWLTLYVFIVSTAIILVASVLVLSWQMIARGIGYTKSRFLTPIDTRASDEEKRRLKSRRRLMPYGVPVALATWVVLVLHQIQSLGQ